MAQFFKIDPLSLSRNMVEQFLNLEKYDSTEVPAHLGMCEKYIKFEFNLNIVKL
jgi:hypothetical protein